jgi:hypothetical protein
MRATELSLSARAKRGEISRTDECACGSDRFVAAQFSRDLNERYKV